MPGGRPYVTPKHQPGAVVYCTTGYARCESFYESLAMLEVPNGTEVNKSKGTGVAAMFNGLVCDLREESKWVWILGDDHSFEPDLLKKLLIRAEMFQCAALVPLVCRKMPPFDSVLFDQHKVRPLDFMDAPEGDEPFKVGAAGTAGMLVQRNVIDKILTMKDEDTDWSKGGWSRPFRIGWGSPDASDEDVYLCSRIKAAGFDIWCDPTLGMDHIPAEVQIRPWRAPNKQWYIRFRWPDGKHFSIPMQRPIR